MVLLWSALTSSVLLFCIKFFCSVSSSVVAKSCVCNFEGEKAFKRPQLINKVGRLPVGPAVHQTKHQVLLKLLQCFGRVPDALARRHHRVGHKGSNRLPSASPVLFLTLLNYVIMIVTNTSVLFAESLKQELSSFANERASRTGRMPDVASCNARFNTWFLRCTWCLLRHFPDSPLHSCMNSGHIACAVAALGAHSLRVQWQLQSNIKNVFNYGSNYRCERRRRNVSSSTQPSIINPTLYPTQPEPTDILRPCYTTLS